mmetsp:Transcript_23125/g.34532  ORF Transcript_23125/g.34532 Transcript_23125/m.34532 type:complete len:144 (+) Transcript_23125:406-837(+)
MITLKSSTDFVPYDCALFEMSEAGSMNGHVRLSDKRWTGLLGSFYMDQSMLQCSHGMILSIPWSSSTFYIQNPRWRWCTHSIFDSEGIGLFSLDSLHDDLFGRPLAIFVCFLLLIPLFSETDPVSLSSSNHLISSAAGFISYQ